MTGNVTSHFCRGRYLPGYMKPRGIIITPSFEVNEDGHAVAWHGIDPSFLRKCVLYWDKIDCPETIIGSSPTGEASADPELQILKQEGVYSQTRGHLLRKDSGTQYSLTFSGEHPREFAICSQLYTFQKYQASDTDWTIGQQPDQSALPNLPSEFRFIEPDDPPNSFSTLFPASEIETEVGPGLKVELYRALPVPSPDVPMETILEFKQKRMSELLALRQKLGDLYFKSIASPDSVGAIDHEVQGVEIALKNLSRVMEESRMKSLFSSVKTSLAVGEISKEATFGAAAGTHLGQLLGAPIPFAVLGALSGVASSLKISMDLSSLKPKTIPNEFKDYAYAYYAQKELG